MSSFTNNRIGDPIESEIIHVLRKKGEFLCPFFVSSLFVRLSFQRVLTTKWRHLYSLSSFLTLSISHADYSLDAVNNYGDDFLHATAANGCYTIIREILKEQGSRNIDTPNDNGWSPLMLAIRNGKVETVKLLLESGCNPDQSTFQGIASFRLFIWVSWSFFVCFSFFQLKIYWLIKV